MKQMRGRGVTVDLNMGMVVGILKNVGRAANHWIKC